MRFVLVLMLALACSNIGVSASSVDVQQGESATVSLVVAGVLAAPAWSVAADVVDGGLTVSVGGAPPNPKNIRGVVFITAARAATLGKQRLTVSAPEVGSTSIEVNVTAAAPVALERASQPRTTLASVEGTPSLFVWVTNAGTVTQRVSGVTAPVPSLTEISSVGAAGLNAYAVQRDGRLWRWNWSVLPVSPEVILEGVEDVNASDFESYALTRDGQVVDLATMRTLSELSDVVAIRVSGFSQQIINGGGIYTAASRYFLKADGTVELRGSVDYLAQQLPNTTSTSLFATNARQVTAHGFIQAADGQVLLGEARVHDLPAVRMASRRASSQTNGSTLVSSTTCLVLFADGALWASVLSKTSGENQQGAPTFSAGVTQTPLRAPGDAPIADFMLVGQQALIFLDDGRLFLEGDDGTFVAADFVDLKRP